MAWVGKDLKPTYFQPLAVGRAATHQMRLPRAPANLALIVHLQGWDVHRFSGQPKIKDSLGEMGLRNTRRKKKHSQKAACTWRRKRNKEFGRCHLLHGARETIRDFQHKKSSSCILWMENMHLVERYCMGLAEVERCVSARGDWWEAEKWMKKMWRNDVEHLIRRESAEGKEVFKNKKRARYYLKKKKKRERRMEKTVEILKKKFNS